MALLSVSNARSSALLAGVVSGVRWSAFWAAVALPFLHVPLLYTGNEHVEVLVALVALNVVCLLAGHRHAGRRRG